VGELHDAPLDLGERPAIGVVKLADLGDVLLVTPLLGALRRRYPGARIEAIVRATGAAALAGNPHLDRVVVAPAGSGIRGITALVRFAADLRRRRFDALLVAHHLTLPSGARRHRLLAAASGARLVVGLDNGLGAFLTHRVPDRGFGHVPEWRYWLALGEVVGTQGAGRPSFAVPPAADEEAARLLAPLRGRRVVAIHPVVGAYGPGRTWPVERFAALAAALAEDPAMGVVVVGGEDARAAGAAIAGRHQATLDLAGRTPLPLLAAVLRASALVVGADSGVVHLAAALDRPTLALFGPSNHRAWAPFGATDGTLPLHRGGPDPVLGRVTALRSDIACSPCFYVGHALGRPRGCATRTCLAELTVERVAEAARRVLAAEAS
jgi:ADP-heptose:LPS heptosyltransferase